MLYFKKFKRNSIIKLCLLIPKTFLWLQIKRVKNKKIFKCILLIKTLKKFFVPDRQLFKLDFNSRVYNVISISPSGNFLAAIKVLCVCIYGVNPVNSGCFQKEILKLKGHTNIITCITFSPSGDYLATGSYDNSALIYCINPLNKEKYGCVILHIKEKVSVTAICFSAFGNFLAIGNLNYESVIYSIDSHNKNFGKVLLRLKDHKDEIYSICFNSNGYYASSSWDETSIIFYRL